jgi:hypothetical protein
MQWQERIRISEKLTNTYLARYVFSCPPFTAVTLTAYASGSFAAASSTATPFTSHSYSTGGAAPNCPIINAFNRAWFRMTCGWWLIPVSLSAAYRVLLMPRASPWACGSGDQKATSST